MRVGQVGWIPGLGEFLRELLSDQAAGEIAYLVERGLVPLSEEERRANVEKVSALETAQ